MLYGFLPAVNVFGVRVNALENGASLAVGPTYIWGVGDQSKNMQFTQLIGDFAYGPLGYGVILDSDFIDTPITDWGPP